MEYKDYYAILGVPKTGTQAEIKKAYRKLARELHPDTNPDADAERRFKEANEANAVLSDPEKRKQYDELGSNWGAYQQAGFDPHQASSWGGFGGAPGGTRWTYRTVSPDEMGGFSDFFRVFFGSDAGGFATTGRAGSGGGFEELYDFGGATGGSRSARASRATGEAEITLAEAMSGTTRMVDVGGRRLEVKIPASVSDGAKIKLRGGGLRADGGAAGDLLITVRIAADKRFERRGSDLHTVLPLSLSEALLGAEVPVATPTGRVKLRIRPNTQNGQQIHVRGRGMPKRGGEKGDMVVTARVVLPSLDEAGQADFVEFAAAHPQPEPSR